MKFIQLVFFCLILNISQSTISSDAIAANPIENWEGVGLSVWDGNTLEVSKDGKIYRLVLATIMAPQRGQPYSKESRTYLKDLVYGQKIHVSVIRYNRYGRIIAEVKIGEKNINAEMVKAGMAWAYTRFNDNESLTQLEETARKEERGLWRDTKVEKPIEPWEFRKNRRNQNSLETSSQDSQKSMPIIDTQAQPLS